MKEFVLHGTQVLPTNRYGHPHRSRPLLSGLSPVLPPISLRTERREGKYRSTVRTRSERASAASANETNTKAGLSFRNGPACVFNRYFRNYSTGIVNGSLSATASAQPPSMGPFSFIASTPT